MVQIYCPKLGTFFLGKVIGGHKRRQTNGMAACLLEQERIGPRMKARLTVSNPIVPSVPTTVSWQRPRIRAVGRPSDLNY